MNILANPAVMMTSVEIADFCGKAHKHVLTDIRRTLTQLGLQPAGFSARYLDAKGEERECIRLPRRETLIVVSGYRLDVRAKIVDHLDALEQALRRPMSPAEMFMQNAELLLNLERQHAEHSQALRAIDVRLDLVEGTVPLKAKPQHTETKSEIKIRINKLYGLPSWLIDEVLTSISYRPPVFAMVKNSHESAQGSSFAVYQIVDVTKLFKRFVSECVRATPTTAKHPAIDRRFQLIQRE